MPYVSARYANAENTKVISTDERGQEWHHDVGSQVGDWLTYIAEDGQIAAYVAPPPPDLNALDQDELNRALAEDGSVVRALAEVMFAEVNKLRVKTGDAPYTRQQYVNALKGQMREPVA